MVSRIKLAPSNSLHLEPESSEIPIYIGSPLGHEPSTSNHEKDKSRGHYRAVFLGFENLSSIFDAGANVFRLNYSHGEPEQKTELYEKIRSLETGNKTTCILADLPGPKLRLGEFPGVKLLNNRDTVRLLCGMKEYDGDEIPVEYDGLSAELKTGILYS